MLRWAEVLTLPPSFTLPPACFSSQQYPAASIKMLSNSRTQKVHIDGVCKAKGFGNVEVITGDFTQFDFEEKEQ